MGRLFALEEEGELKASQVTKDQVDHILAAYFFDWNYAQFNVW